MNSGEIKEELKKTWILFLLFGIFFLIISAIVNTFIGNWINEKSQGPPCRIEFSQDEFQMENSTSFYLKYLFVNLRDKDLLIEGIDSYCYWSPLDLAISKEETINTLPSADELSAPKEFEKFPASQSKEKISYGCRSPDQEGEYKIRILAKTTSGNCEGNILMEVK